MELKEKISRNNFLRQLGFSGAALMAVYGLDSCLNESAVTPSGAGLSLDLANASYAKLKNSGSYVVVNKVVVANYNGNYIAATLKCSHEGQNQIQFNNNEWYCTAHGARFSTTGKGLNSNGSRGLTVYTTSLVGDILTVNA
ncbi:Rieske (2Fe-2S) protein [Lacihabitans sp. LS3-19]|uniref:Rieske 2Fe-2S domain-containing protein n=1 Tax=Lacihabitans sp. LS3-19 TaxID=2487335 RepID=UPI0020CC4610|nr:Rieske 2Fe-2S domain-containing protein [Lacihabitans sp. LS3-19]MCP9768901.1 Rieske (2Fe-2S) protein [Lacihabitans sp. LS3-19]